MVIVDDIAESLTSAVLAAQRCRIVELCSLCLYWPVSAMLFDGDAFWPACGMCVGEAQVIG